MPLHVKPRLSALALSLLGNSAFAITTTAVVIGSVASPTCLEYRVVGICYWLACGPFGCSVTTSVKVHHFVPDAVVSSYANTGQSTWLEMSWMSPPTPGAQGGGNGTTNQAHENDLATFKNADVIGHPGEAAFTAFASQFGGTVCRGAGKAFTPYFISTFDTLAWRHGIPEVIFPESLTPGMREIGARPTFNLWGNVYPRSGFGHQVDDHKAAAVVAQRAGDIVTRPGQIHVYQPLLAAPSDGYWPAGPLFETNPLTGKWQELTPVFTNTCAVFPNPIPHLQAQQGDYAWTLWRPYRCCNRRGQIFLGSADFSL